MGKGKSTEMDERHGCGCLGHSNWTICSLLSQFCSVNFPTFSLLYWEASSYYPREGQAENGKMEISQPVWDTVFSVPGAFKLDHLQQIKPILFPKFSNFFTFILGGQLLLPYREEGWKWEYGILPTRARHKVFSAWGIQTGPFAAC